VTFEHEANGHIAPSISAVDVVVHRIRIGEDVAQTVPPRSRRIDRLLIVIAARNVW
jgi:hypothetical protein